MAISLPDARELSHEVLEALRLRAVHGCQLGFTETELADLLNAEEFGSVPEGKVLAKEWC